MSSAVTGCNIHLYADDTILFWIVNDAHSDINSLQLCFSDLQVALSNNKLLLNADKSKFMLFSRSTNMNLDSLIISTNNGTNIERLTE